MAITASMVKELRQATGAGMMDCKKALTETDGDMDAAIEFLRKKGMAGADKKAGRVAAEGVIAIAISDDKKTGMLAEVNCETDFVAKGDEFKAFANEIAALALAADTLDVEEIMALTMSSGKTVDITRREMIARIGENMALRFVQKIESNGLIGQYQHGEKIGVGVALEGGDEALARDIAMHVAAVNPSAITADEVDQEMLAKERKFQIEQAQESGKPAEIIEKMIDGRMRKFLQEITLVGQAFVKNPDVTIEKLLKENGATVTAFIRLEVGAGIDIEETDFAEEVALAAKAVTG
ncbi:Translation elongation factor Ts [hydrothermal vent metagenome]|uniref:Translation elongation factor Ts n=1 Tax=hydrothermal vent metagenome TaxID=652676 RepID=A0A3B0WYK1_9ZZZZ